jgi:hypothetical protein
VLLALLAVLRWTAWGRRLRRSALPAVAIVILLLTVGMNVGRMTRPADRRAWRGIVPGQRTLFERAHSVPLNAYTFGNESLLFLNAYLRGRTLVVAEKSGRRRIWEDNGAPLVSASTGKELIFADIVAADFNDRLTEQQVARLLQQPHYGCGVPGRNYAVFLFGDDYRACARVRLFWEGSTFYLLPQPPAPQAAGTEAATWK